MIGMGSNILFVLYNTSRPDVQCECVDVGGQQVILITPDQSLFFSAAEYVKYKVLKAVTTTHPNASLVVLNGHYVHHMDATMATNLKSLVDDCQLLGKLVLFWNWQPQPMGVAIRLTAELFQPLFKSAPTLDSLLEMVHSSTPSDAVSIVQHS